MSPYLKFNQQGIRILQHTIKNLQAKNQALQLTTVQKLIKLQEIGPGTEYIET